MNDLVSDAHLDELAVRTGQALLQRKLSLVSAESCTGGWVAKVLTDIAGSSEWFERGYVTYSNASKQQALGVAPETLAAHGAVSEPVVREMARGALERSDAAIAVAISGIAGPAGGTPDKPVGLVWFAWAGPAGVTAQQQVFAGDRDAVRRQAVAHALRGVLGELERGE